MCGLKVVLGARAAFSFSSFAVTVASLLRRSWFLSQAFVGVTWGHSYHCQLLELFWVLAWDPEGGPVSEVLSELRGGGRHCPPGFREKPLRKRARQRGQLALLMTRHVVCSPRKRALCTLALDWLSHMDSGLSLALSLSSPNPHEM